MSVIEILILILYGGKIYILLLLEKKWLYFMKKKKNSDCIGFFFVFIYEGGKINVKMFYFFVINCFNSFCS